jgi:hypothetical protein
MSDDKLFEEPQNEYEEIANKAWEDGREERERRLKEEEQKERERLRGSQLELTEPPAVDPGKDEGTGVVTVEDGKAVAMAVHDPDPEWQALEVPKHDFGGMRPRELVVSDIFRFDEDHQPIVRYYDAKGERCGLGRATSDLARGLLADYPGVALLRGELPNQEAIAFGAITHVAVGTSLIEFCRLIKWSATPATRDQYGGVPSLAAVNEAALEELEVVSWPKSVTFCVLTKAAEQLITEAIFGARTLIVDPGA